MPYNKELLVFKESSHRYYYDGEPVPGVTTILNSISKGDGLIYWAVNQAVNYLENYLVGDLTTEELKQLFKDARKAHEREKDKAGAIGSLAHNWIEQHLKGGDAPFPDDPNATNSCKAALKWLDEHHWKTLAVEDRIFSPTHFYAGTCDWLAEIDGVLSVPDWKTSKSIHSSYHYQTAAYLKAIEEETGMKIPSRWILRIDKETGDFEEQQLSPESLEGDFQAFLAAKTIYESEKEKGRKH